MSSATLDPNPDIHGEGIATRFEKLQASKFHVGVWRSRGEGNFIAPFSKWVTTGRPWVHAKWAMSLDGKIAARDLSSKWISGETSRACVHQLRGRVDAILVGSGTVIADNPQVDCSAAGAAYVATRVVLDRRGRIAGRLRIWPVATAGPACVGFCRTRCRRPTIVRSFKGSSRIEVIKVSPPVRRTADWTRCSRTLGRRDLYPRVCVRGAPAVLGALFDARLVDEVHAFISPKL